MAIFFSNYFKRCLDFSGNFEGLFLKVMKEKFGSQVQVLWHARIFLICWLIWKSQNEKIFEEKKSLPSLLKSLDYCFFTTNKIVSGFMRNNMEEFIILHDLGIKVNPGKSPTIILVHWNPPPPR